MDIGDAARGRGADTRVPGTRPQHDSGPAYQGQPNQPVAPQAVLPTKRARPVTPSTARPARVHSHSPGAPNATIIVSNARLTKITGISASGGGSAADRWAGPAAKLGSSATGCGGA